jgi:hypothetical protein
MRAAERRLQVFFGPDAGRVVAARKGRSGCRCRSLQPAKSWWPTVAFGRNIGSTSCACAGAQEGVPEGSVLPGGADSSDVTCAVHVGWLGG